MVRASYPTLDNHMNKQESGKYQNGAGTLEGYHGQHEAMAEGNIDLFVRGMMQFDKQNGTKHSADWYNAMAWMGSLQAKTNAWNNLPQAQRAMYERIINNEVLYNQHLSAKADGNTQQAQNFYNQINQKLFNETRCQ